ncbi:MAG: hypothetical protein ACTSU2_00055 [Promethearchaeota archaeon]
MVRKKIGSKILDYILLIASWISLLGSIFMGFYFYYFMVIKSVQPYVLNVIVFVLGIIGYKIWRKENID